MRATGTVLLVVGYAVAVTVLSRLVPVLRQRRRRWFVILESAAGCIVVGWSLLNRPLAAFVNGGFLVAFALAWTWTGRRGRR